jgi:hypothetical protein
MPSFHYLLLFIWWFAICVLLESVSLADWTSFVVVRPGNLNDSMDVLLSSHVQHYWDQSKSSFRLGLLAAHINESHPELVGTFEKRMMVGQKTVLLNTSVVDAPSVFVHGIGFMKYLYSRLLTTERRLIMMGSLNNSILQQYNVSGLDRDLIGKSMLLPLALDSVSSHLTFIKLKKEIAAHRLNKFTAYEKVKISEQSRLELDMFLDHVHKIDEIANDKERAALSIASSLFSAQLVDFNATKKQEFSVAELRMQTDLRLELGAIDFRKAMQAQQIKNNEVIALRVISAGADHSMRLRNEAINTMMSEVGRSFEFAISQTTGTSLLRFAMCLFVSIFISVVVVECTGFLRVALSSKLAHAGSNQKPREVPALATVGFQAGITLNADVDQNVRNACSWLQLSFSQSRQRMPLCSMLLLGPSGTGKSHISRVVALSSGLAVMFIGAADLQSMSSDAPIYLNGIFKDAEQAERRTIVVIDEADEIVARSAAKQHSAVIGGVICALLEALRNNSMFISVFIAARLEIHDVNPALVDRLGKASILI